MSAEGADVRRSTRVVASLVAASFVFLAACEEAVPQRRPSVGNGLVAFVPPDPRDIGISLVDPVRGDVRTLTRDVRDVTGLAWSPDGRKIAYVQSGHSGIGIVDAATGRNRVLTARRFPSGTMFSRPTWSPDAARVAFAASRVPSDVNCEELECLALVQAHIYVMDAEGGEPVRLTGDDVLPGDPAWSPDGERIAFVAVSPWDPGSSEPPGRLQVYVMDADGSSVRRLPSFGHVPRDLVWSPDGASLAFGTVASDIFVMDADGGSPRRIVSSLIAADGSYENADPAWSPDGRRLLFTRSTEGGDEVWVVDADGSDERELIDGCCASWQPLSEA